MLPVADVCSKGQGDGDHVRAGGFDLTLMVALWYFGRSGAFPHGVSSDWVVNVGQLVMGSQERRFRMIAFQFIIPAMVLMSILYIFHHAGSPCQKFSFCAPLGATP